MVKVEARVSSRMVLDLARDYGMAVWDIADSKKEVEDAINAWHDGSLSHDELQEAYREESSAYALLNGVEAQINLMRRMIGIDRHTILTFSRIVRKHFPLVCSRPVWDKILARLIIEVAR